MIYSCCNPRRLDVLADPNQTAFNGIRFLDVVDSADQPPADRQRTLRVHFVHPLLPGQLSAANVKISGGERIRNIRVLQAFDENQVSPAGDPNVLVVVVDGAGDFTMYTLSLVDTANPGEPPAGFDQILSSIQFFFKVACESDFDCASKVACPPPAPERVDISYLAKDYASFRALMLDRLSKIIPQWLERSPADLGIVLVELISYLGDYLSYLQDAVATEAYLGTARLRTSIRRLSRLVDYSMLDGRNARAWVHLDLRSDVHQLSLAQDSLQFLTKTNEPSVVLVKGKDSIPYQSALNASPRVFELLEAVKLSADLNSLRFYTWGNGACCLPQGSTQAWLWGSLPALQPGMVLIFEEVKGPETGAPEDADPSHRVAVRLTKADPSLSDPLGGQFLDPPSNTAIPVTRIEWGPEDALPFPVCISSVSVNGSFDDVSMALGNNALADDGRTISDELLPPVPAPNPVLTIPAAPGTDRCNVSRTPPKPARFRPSLKQSPLTFTDGSKYDPSASAYAAMHSRDTSGLLPAITLYALPSKDPWNPQRDLLESDKNATEFVAEVENDSTAYLRFGDGIFGLRPSEDTPFSATYRIGLGLDGNVGADTLRHVASSDPLVISDLANPVIVSVRNPLAASGGLEPESIESVRQSAPYAFRVQDRAVTPDDYGKMAKRADNTVQRAMGTFRWTGSWQTVFISVDPKGSESLSDAMKNNLRRNMEYYRMAGHDVEVDAAVYVSLEIAVNVCVKPGYFAADVELALLDVLSNRELQDGTRGVFHPDNFTFGQTVYLSPIYARVQATSGVDSVIITKFQRQGQDSDQGLNEGKLNLHRLEIARLDNDPDFPEHGTLKFTFVGGR
jgi:hypothetical protein